VLVRIVVKKKTISDLSGSEVNRKKKSVPSETRHWLSMHTPAEDFLQNKNFSERFFVPFFSRRGNQNPKRK
jgi:hypothetical protein